MKKRLSFGIFCLILCFAYACSRSQETSPKPVKSVQSVLNKSSEKTLEQLSERETKWIYARLSPEMMAQVWLNRLQRKLINVSKSEQIAFIKKAMATISP